MKSAKIVVLVLLFAIFLQSCQESQYESYDVDFAIKDTTISFENKIKMKTLKMAISGMISPKETYVSYNELLKYLENKLGITIELIQKKTYKEVNELIENDELDFAMICSGAYVDLSSKIQLDIIAVPQRNGLALYRAYIITQKNNKIDSFDDLRNKKFAFTDPLSNTGKLYPTRRVNEFGSIPEDYFSKIIYTYGHDNSISLVNKNIVDGASVDGLIYDFLVANSPSKVSNIKIIEKSEYFGIPPIVCKLNSNIQIQRIRKVLYDMDEEEEGKKILKKLNIERFIPGFDSSYNSIRYYKKVEN